MFSELPLHPGSSGPQYGPVESNRITLCQLTPPDGSVGMVLPARLKYRWAAWTILRILTMEPSKDDDASDPGHERELGTS